MRGDSSIMNQAGGRFTVNHFDASCQEGFSPPTMITWRVSGARSGPFGPVPPGGEVMIQAGEVFGREILVIQARNAHVTTHPVCGLADHENATPRAEVETPAPRRGGRVAVVTALIGAVGVIVAALVAGVFTVWHG
ncbi:hypothetical protein [Dactylosporangium maewongense]|uniref:hypothetical protein n=1 Tax=Dactylosporangium TaxID=35753 RepID=UPI0031CE5392